MLLNIFLAFSASTVSYHGKYVRDEQVKQLQTKLSSQSLSKHDVSALIGSPAFIPAYNSNIWYYIHYTTKNKFWAFNKLLAQRIIILTFSPDSEKLMRILVLDNNIANRQE
ncbi:outer membrane protein assembly factor BamE domain-containing protein [Candidatus Orientia mediorientalis]|uniref:outer membrane protein assembly factor BamE domain-containing protein n=1 Tax=Candidatus Orientia mediorientalis TaxID=911112 RepID=UPI001E362DC7|nr:outer membrane protein assembly factor BamE [Candidatus Orientia mediorientalis]